MAKSTTPTAQQVGEAVLLLASLFNSGAAAPQSTASTASSKSDEKPAPTASTPEAPKADESPFADTGEWSKRGMTWAQSFKDKGVTAKGLLTEFSVEKFSDVPVEKRAEFAARQEELTETAAMS